jgi:hypothetical protein
MVLASPQGLALRPKNQFERIVMRHSLTAVVVLIAALSVVGCSQSTLPTVPSSASSVASSSLGPGASYNPSGMWRFVSTLQGNSAETWDTDVSQDGDGNLHFLAEDGAPVTLERLGTGVIITYRLSTTGDEDGTDCDVRVHGTVRLDTTTDTMTGLIRLKELGCSNERGQVVVTGTKLS